MPNLCCEIFDDLLTCAGKAGVGVIAFYISKEKSGFILETRAVDAVHCPPQDTEDRPRCRIDPTKEAIEATDGKAVLWRISEHVCIQYCPFCGQNLNDLIANSFDAFYTFADSDQHREAFKRTGLYRTQRAIEGFR